MKHLFSFFVVATLLLIVGCSKEYDDSALVGRVDNLESRVQRLEQLSQQMNTNISALQTLVTALQNNDYVTGVVPITKDGEIVGYTSNTSSVSSGDYALQNRLTITVKVKFTNAIDDKMSFNRNFSAYADYDSTKLLTEVESELIPQIVEQLVTDIFQAAASNW